MNNESGKSVAQVRGVLTTVAMEAERLRSCSFISIPG